MVEAPDAASATVQHASDHAFLPTVQRVEHAIEAAGMSILARIDHAALARGVGLEMLPTLVLLYGNPRGGTPIMIADPLAALELPLRVLIHEDPYGRVMLAFHPIKSTLMNAGIPEDLAVRLEPAQKVILEGIRP